MRVKHHSIQDGLTSEGIFPALCGTIFPDPGWISIYPGIVRRHIGVVEGLGHKHYVGVFHTDEPMRELTRVRGNPCNLADTMLHSFSQLPRCLLLPLEDIAVTMRRGQQEVCSLGMCGGAGGRGIPGAW